MENESAPVALPGDVAQAIEDLGLPTSHQISHLFALTAAEVRTFRERYTALHERLAQLEPDVKKQCQTQLLHHFATAFPKTGACGCVTRAGQDCTSQPTEAGGGLVCGRHVHEALRLPDGTGPVRGRCQECKGPLDSDALGCIRCPRALCTNCAKATTGHLPGESVYSGVCSICTASNPSLTIFTYLVGRSDDENLVIFQANHDVFDLDGLFESSCSLLSAHDQVYLNTTVQDHFPPVYTPQRQRRTPSRSAPPAPLPTGDGTGTAAAVAMASQAPPAGAAGGAPPAPTTTQERLDRLLQHTAAGAAGISFSPEEIQQLQRAVQSTQPFHAGGTNVLTPIAPPAGTAPPPPSSNDANHAAIIQALAALAIRSQPGTSGGGATTTGEHFTAPSTAYQQIFNFLGEIGHFARAEFHSWFDPLGTGETKRKQLANTHLFGSSRADMDRATYLAPGNQGLVYDAHSEQNVITTRSSQRQLPAMHTILNRFPQWLTLLQSLKQCEHGVYKTSHPQHEAAMELLNITIGTVLFLKELLASQLASGRTYEVAYIIVLFYHEKHLGSVTLHPGSELNKRMLAIGSADPLSQTAAAQGVVLLTADYDNIRSAEEFVAARNTGKGRDSEGGPPKDKKKKTRTAPERTERTERTGLCGLCGKADCPGYEYDSYLCTNEITQPCTRCGALHARKGPRQTACAPRAPPRNGGRGGRGNE